MSSFALTLYLGTDLKRAMEKEEITGTHAEKLGSCGPCLWWRCTSSSQETQLADFIIEEAVFLCLLRKELAGLASLVWESSVAVVSSCKQQAVGSCGGYFTHGEQRKALPFPSGWRGKVLPFTQVRSTGVLDVVKVMSTAAFTQGFLCFPWSFHL